MRRPFVLLIACVLAAAGADADPLATPDAPGATAVAATEPLPDAAAQKAAVAELRKLYKDQYAAKRPSLQKAFALKLRDLAKEGKDDAATRWAALSESEQLSAQAGDLAGVLDSIDLLAAAFSGYDAAAERRATLGKLKIPAAKALLTLLDKPLDPAANGESGRYFCFEAARWDLGLPLLANGDDPALAKLAAREAEPPTEAAKQADLGDGWYDAAGAQKKEAYKGAEFLRAHHWYGKALPGLTGVAKERIAQREVEIFAYLPDAQRDYAAMTAKQWEKLKEREVKVDVTSRVDTKLAVKPGQRVRVVPNPEDTWTFNWLKRFKSTVDWKGDVGAGRLLGRERGRNRAGQLTPGCLTYQLGETDQKEVEIAEPIDAPGKLWLSPFDPGHDGETGFVRVKLVLLDEE